MEETVTFQCPHCWQTVTMNVDLLVKEQEYVQDCEVCCNPLTVYCRANGERVTQFRVEAAQ